MSLVSKIAQVERIHTLIKFKRTGNPNEFANKLGISRSMLYNILSELKELGAPIEYCKKRYSFYYVYPVEFTFGFMAEIGQTKQRNIGAGFQGFRNSFEFLSESNIIRL